jgi:S1-C subfamily serine protease
MSAPCFRRQLSSILFLAIFLILGSLNVSHAYTAHYDQDELDNISVYERAAQAVVTINALVDGHPSSGSGVLIDETGVILTSSHVVGGNLPLEKRGFIRIALSDGRRFDAKMLGSAAGQSDLALLKVTPTVKGLPFLSLGDSRQVRVGQKVLAIGNPYGFERTLTTGIVSRIDTARNRIQTDAAINPGSSGGPMLDTQGHVIGLNQSIYNPDGNRSNIGIGFAVPVNTIRSFLKALSEEPSVNSVVGSDVTFITREPGVRLVSIILQRVSNQP